MPAYMLDRQELHLLAIAATPLITGKIPGSVQILDPFNIRSPFITVAPGIPDPEWVAHRIATLWNSAGECAHTEDETMFRVGA